MYAFPLRAGSQSERGPGPGSATNQTKANESLCTSICSSAKWGSCSLIQPVAKCLVDINKRKEGDTVIRAQEEQ